MTHFIIEITPDFKKGDMPPEGYIEWHEWARVQSAAGLKQSRCGMCSKWRFPQEMNPEIHLTRARTKKNGGKIVTTQYQNCLHCQPVNELEKP